MNRLIKLHGLIKLYSYKFLKGNKLKMKGIKGYVGKGSKIIIENDATIEFGNKVWVSDYCAIISTGKGVCIGENSYLNSNVRIISMDDITIGNNCLFAPNIVIIDHNHNFETVSELICKQGYKCKPIEIGSDCWICANTVICPGAFIGDHIVVAANSVVKGKLEHPGIYAGNPAKLVKRR